MIEIFLKSIEQYAKNRIKIYKLYISEFLALLFVELCIQFIIIVLFILSFIFLTIGLSLWIGELLGKTYWGFLIVSATCLFIAILTNRYDGGFIKRKLYDSATKHIKNTQEQEEQ